MTKFFLRWVILAAAVALAAWVTGLILPNQFKVQVSSVPDVFRFILGVGVLSVLNATLGQILKLASLPLNCLTLGLISLVINALMLMLAGSFNLGFSVNGFLGAFVGSILISIINGVLGGILIKSDEDEK
ncbi:MAG: phage holin family protein [Fimbriimonadaceae bacterium]|jgi:putative membrane protein|nr:phage holin family protein [Fimbriimonadaceae bacterium]